MAASWSSIKLNDVQTCQWAFANGDVESTQIPENRIFCTVSKTRVSDMRLVYSDSYFDNFVTVSFDHSQQDGVLGFGISSKYIVVAVV
jgi:hypothetical protein